MNAYYERTILDADPVALIRMVYARALECVAEARRHLREGLIPERAKSIVRTYEALAELQRSLRTDAAPELAARMAGLYGYMQSRLLEANLEQKDGPLAEVQTLLTTLHEGWTGVEKEMRMSSSQEFGMDERLAMIA